MGEGMSEQMKTITYEGHQYEVPTWVNFVAEDADGYLGGYEFEPVVMYSDDEWSTGGRIHTMRLQRSWKGTMRPV